jgi:extracellular factor (EF) 3-hydroxypalmitic acid methyl ester biosynthesis protein
MQSSYIDVSMFDLAETDLRYLSAFDEEVERFNKELEKIAATAYDAPHQEELLEQTKRLILQMLSACKMFDKTFYGHSEIIKQAQQEFRSRTNRIFQQSFFMNRARTWPQGYPGDFKTLEYTYGNAPMSDGIGFLLDKYFLETTLAVAVRERLRSLCDILKQEIIARPQAQVLNIACGSCREIFDIAPEFIHTGASAMCIDFDKDALQFSSDRLSCSGISMSKISFKKYNAVKMVNRARNLREFGPRDIIYSTGFYDYIPDDVLRPLLEASYELLKPGGVLIASFKDSTGYETPDYHWLVKWDSFLQRTEKQTDALVSRSMSSQGVISKQREKSGVIHFYTVTKPR